MVSGESSSQGFNRALSAFLQLRERVEYQYRRYHIVAESDIHEAGARLDAATTGKVVTTKLLQFNQAARGRKPRSRKIA